ncbi:MAG TPA: hypothetical protein VLX59_03035 [Acidimicrobiales bacterium]|nr:hypothetical protein [Acidimicrobiales bacterium]
MGLRVEIVEGSSVIVVTLTGPTDIAALEPLHDALHVAASEGKTVVLDVRELTHVTALTSIIDALGPAAATLKLVVRPPTLSAQPPVPGAEVHTSVDAAIDATGAGSSPNGATTDADLAAKFHDLSDRYAQMIGHCRQLLHDVENPP